MAKKKKKKKEEKTKKEEKKETGAPCCSGRTADTVVLLVVGLLVGMFIGAVLGAFLSPVQQQKGQSDEIAPEEAKALVEKTLTNVTEGQVNFTIGEVLDMDGLYRVELVFSYSFLGQEIEVMQYSYLSKDGKYLLPAVYLTGNASALPQAPPQEEETPEETPEEPPEEPEEPPVFDAPDMEVPNVRFFVMSFCPFGQQAERGLRPVHDLLGDKIELEPNYVVYSGYCTSLAYNLEQSEQGFGDMTKEEWIEDCKPKYCLDGENYCSMHGIAELNEDIRQLCIYNNYDSDTFWNYLEYVWTNCQLGNIEECWKEAANSTGVDAETVETCFIEEGVDMIKAEKELGDEYAVRGSPTVFVNEGTYVGGRAPEDYKRGICSGFVEPPAECEETLTASGSTSTGSC